jgi:para-nitrobenzyl esterase
MRTFSRVLAHTLLIANSLLCAVEAQTVELRIGETVYVGTQSDDAAVNAFVGIPFAEPPVGRLRWQPPQPAKSPPGRQLAHSFKPACAQLPHMLDWYRGVIESFGGDPASFPVPEFSEDCLYLNIWTPAVAESAAKPVVVYIHGGSNKGGWAYEPNYIGENLARMGVVVVSIPYRLGVLGFFAHPELTDKNPGILDQIAALKWVAQNIRAAGGDPEQVTLMGESAGANNIDHLLVSPMARGLFQRVIHQSGGWAITATQERSDAERRAAELQQALLKESGGGLPALQAVPLNDLLAAAGNVFADHYFDPVVDGSSLTASVQTAVLSGDLPQFDLLIGSNTDEWLMYLSDTASLDSYLAENFAAQPEQATALRKALSGMNDRKAVDRLTTGQNFVCPSIKLASYVSRAGGKSWMYVFARQRDGERAAAMGAYHGAELPYVFGMHDEWLPTAAEDRKLSMLMMQYWANFIRTGNPNGGTLPDWPMFEEGRKATQRLDTALHNEPHPSAELCDILGIR